MRDASKYTDGPAVGGSKYAAAASKVAGAPLGSCRFVSMDATAKPSFGYGSRGLWDARRLRTRTAFKRRGNLLKGLIVVYLSILVDI